MLNTLIDKDRILLDFFSHLTALLRKFKIHFVFCIF